MSTQQGSIVQDDFSGGAFHDTADYLIPPMGVRELTDAFLEADGAAIERGGTIYKSGAAFGSSLRWIFDGYFAAGQRTVFANTADFGVLAADDSTVVNLGSDGLSTPKPSAYLAGMLFIGGGYIYGGSRKAGNATTGLAYSTGTVTTTNGSKVVTGSGTTWNTLVDAGQLFQTAASERVYVIASVDSTTQITLEDAYEGTTGAAKTYGLYSIYEITAADPYPTADAYAVCANRLFWFENNFVHASEELAPHDDTATIGGQQIPLIHELPEGVRVTGLGTVGQTLLVFTTHGVWTIEGLIFDIADTTGNPQQRLARHSGEHILWDANGIRSWEQALVVPCVNGIFLIDGISPPVRVSHPFDEHVMTYVDSGYKLGQAIVDRDHYILPVVSGTSTMRDQLVCRINRPIRIQGSQTIYPWSHFDHHAKSMMGYALRVGESTREPLVLGASSATDARVVECRYFDPGADVTEDANGDVPTLDLITRAYPTGNDTQNMVRNARTRYELVSENPAIEFSYALGSPRSGVLQYDTGLLYDDDHFYGTGEDAGGFEAACVGGESDGREPKRCRVNTPTRFFTWRIRNPQPSSSCRIRGIDIRVRPSAAVRR